MKTFPFIALLLVSLNSLSQSKPKFPVYPQPSKSWPTKNWVMENVVTGIRFIPPETRHDHKSNHTRLFFAEGAWSTLGYYHGFPIYSPSW